MSDTPQKPRQPNDTDPKDQLQPLCHITIREWDNWERVQQATTGYPDVKVVGKRLKPMLEGIEFTVVIERQYIDKDYRDSHSAYFSKRFHTPSNRCLRLHFFRGELGDGWIGDPNLEYLGYSVVSPIKPGGMGRTLISADHVRCPEGSHLHAKTCDEDVHLMGREFPVRGFPYTCQDEEVARCAQASLWMLVRYFSNKYRSYREIGPHQLANLVSDLHLGRLFPTDGLTIWQSAEILRRLGFHPVVHHRSAFVEKDGGSYKPAEIVSKLGFNTPEEAFAHLFYTYIESGIPLLVATQTHARVAFGHYSDYQSTPSAQHADTDGFFHSSVFNKGFLIHDDAKYLYHPLGLGSGDTPSFDKVTAFIAPMPEKTFLPPDTHQRLVRQLLLSEGEYGMKQACPDLAEAVKGNKIVLRNFLTTGTKYKASLLNRNGLPDRFAGACRLYSLPHFVWITEIFELENYPEHCIGQVVWDATAAPEDLAGLLFLHYPGAFFMNLAPHANRPLGPLPDDIRRFSALHSSATGFCSFEPFKENLNHRHHNPRHV